MFGYRGNESKELYITGNWKKKKKIQLHVNPQLLLVSDKRKTYPLENQNYIFLNTL